MQKNKKERTKENLKRKEVLVRGGSPSLCKTNNKQ
jgi:hypothetical protein